LPEPIRDQPIHFLADATSALRPNRLDDFEHDVAIAVVFAVTRNSSTFLILVPRARKFAANRRALWVSRALGLR
jgi:hypothetical protein